MSDMGIKVSKPGVDVGVAIGNELLLDTSEKNLKYVRNIKFESAGQREHKLGYTPVCWTWGQDSNGWWRKTPSAFIPSVDGGDLASCYCSSDETYIYSSKGYAEFLLDRGFTNTTDIITGGSGIKVSAPGKDVETAPPYDLIYDSFANIYKVYATGTLTLSWAEDEEGWKNIDFAHNLGYAPKVFLFGEDGQEPSWTSSGYEGQEIFNYFSNTTHIRLVGQRADFYGGILGPLPAYTQTFTYFIFLDQIDDDEFES